MLRTIFILSFIATSPPSAWAALDNTKIIEHQIRLCDSEKNILQALDIKKDTGKARDVLYVETTDQFYRNNGWVIRIKVKPNSSIIDIKKRFNDQDLVPDLKNLECEYDKHGASLEKTCKLSSELPTKDVKDIINQNKSWQNLLSSTQKKWLESQAAIRVEARINGILSDARYEVEHEGLDTITLDTVYLQSDKTITYHEISTRYDESAAREKSVLFDYFIKSKGIALCNDQLDWSINKFDVMSVIDHY